MSHVSSTSAQTTSIILSNEYDSEVDRNNNRLLSVNPETNKIYVTNGNNISIINGATNEVVSSISLGDNPTDIAVNPETNKIYVITSSPRMWIIDGETNNLTTV